MTKECKIGSIRLENRIFLAPMLEYNDIAFRILCKQAGAGLVYTGMISPLNPNPIDLEDKPAIQICTNSTKNLKNFIKRYENKASSFDFNLGCPSKIAKKVGVGVFLKDFKIIEKILKEIKDNTKIPLTIKIRKSKEAGKIVKLAEKYCSAICIHPRTAEQGYSGEADLDFARQIKKKSKLPIIYSGDVNEKNYKELLETFDFLMIAREAIGDPNIFARIAGKKEIKNPFTEYLKLAKKYKPPYSQIKTQALAFTRKKPNAKKLRLEIVKARSLEEIKEIMHAF